MAGSGEIRLFCALRLPGDVVEELSRWHAQYLTVGHNTVGHNTPGRIVAAANLHVTLAFLGNRPPGDVPPIARELAAAAGACTAPLSLSVERYRETRSAGMLVLQDAGGLAAAFAEDVRERLERLGVYRQEERPWLPHITVLRFRERPQLEPPLPELGEISPSDAAVYSSVLRSGGAQYDVLQTVVLGR